MANDRIHIRCDSCGAWKMLAKHNGAGLSASDQGILEWVEAHGQCHPHVRDVDLGGVVGFSLHLDGDIGGVLDPAKQNAWPPDPAR